MKSGIYKRSLVGAGIYALLLTGACHNGNIHSGAGGGDSLATFLHEQTGKIASPMLETIHNGRKDSITIADDSVKAMIAVFLPDLSNLSSAALYKETSFPDSAGHHTVVSYQALNDSTALDMADLYIDPETKAIRKVYLQYVVSGGDSSVRRQLIWEADKQFTLLTSIDKNGYTADIRQQKVSWSKP